MRPMVSTFQRLLEPPSPARLGDDRYKDEISLAYRRHWARSCKMNPGEQRYQKQIQEISSKAAPEGPKGYKRQKGRYLGAGEVSNGPGTGSSLNLEKRFLLLLPRGDPSKT
jgi:hypothetical protein